MRARPVKTANALGPGAHPLGIRSTRDAILYVPKTLDTSRPAALLVYLHGAGGPRQEGTQRMVSAADEHGFALLSPVSGEMTWDAIRGSYGPDVRMIDDALKATFAAIQTDPRRIALSGFSDGASYALGLGLSNGDLFKSVLAFSPGFIPPGANPAGKPRVFVSHGTADPILPIESASRLIVPQLKHGGFKVTYQEFDGPHTLPREILNQAMLWFLSE